MIGVELAPGSDATATAPGYGERFTPARGAAIEQWQCQTLGPIVDQITVAAGVAGLVAVALAALMTALFARMLLARDSGPISIQQGIGTGDAGLRGQYLTRILLVLVVGVVIGTVAANTLGERLITLMFEAMFGGFERRGQGTSRIDLVVDPRFAYLLLPIALLAVVALATLAGSRSITTASISSLVTH